MLSSRDLGLDIPGTKFRKTGGILISLLFPSGVQIISSLILRSDAVGSGQYEDTLFCLITPHALRNMMQAKKRQGKQEQRRGHPGRRGCPLDMVDWYLS